VQCAGRVDPMLKRWQFWLAMGASGLACVLVLANMALFTQNRAAQQAIATRQQYIQQSVQLEALYQQLVKGAAELSARNNDEQLRSVLNAQGITFSRNQAPPAVAPVPAPVPAPNKK
jgi:ABC-type transport system involved in cytochrome bd biosynthesis fused ATPase/permease subunit